MPESDDLLGPIRPLSISKRMTAQELARAKRAMRDAETLRPQAAIAPSGAQCEFWHALRDQLTTWEWHTWFDGARLEGNTLQASDELNARWIAKHYAALVAHAAVIAQLPPLTITSR